MENELTLTKAMSTLETVISFMKNYVKVHKCVRRQEAVVFEEQLKYIKSACMAKAIAELTRDCIDEMEASWRRIEQKGFSGDTLVMAMELLNIQYLSLSRILKNYDLK